LIFDLYTTILFELHLNSLRSFWVCFSTVSFPPPYDTFLQVRVTAKKGFSSETKPIPTTNAPVNKRGKMASRPGMRMSRKDLKKQEEELKIKTQLEATEKQQNTDRLADLTEAERAELPTVRTNITKLSLIHVTSRTRSSSLRTNVSSLFIPISP
jgi:hypothetical protein